MLVERKGRHGFKAPQKSTENKVPKSSGTQFQTLKSLKDKDKDQNNPIIIEPSNKDQLSAIKFPKKNKNSVADMDQISNTK